MRQRYLIIYTGALVLVLIAAGVFLAYPSLDTSPQPFRTGASPAVDHEITAVPSAAGTTAAIVLSPKISQEQATAVVREDYDEYTYSIVNTSLTGQYTGKTLYAFELAPANGPAGRNETVLIDAITGDYYNPAQENAKISIDTAKNLARTVFPQLSLDRVKIRFSDGSQYARGWEFYLKNGSEKLVHGSLDADTGELSWYARGIKHKDRPVQPSISLDSAQRAADREILERNGVLPLVLSDARLDPLGMPGEKVAGEYVFVYKRVIRNVSCDSDGLTLGVDSVTGTVVDYYKSWSLPENAAAPSAEPAIPKKAAIATVMAKAAEVYPDSVSGIHITSAELRWKDLHNPDLVVPAPGGIPLAWKVQFDDDIIRAQQWPNSATGWVDAQTGKLLDLYYRH